MKHEGFIRSNADRLITVAIQIVMLIYLIYALSGCAITGTKSVNLFDLIKWDNFAGQKAYAGYENIDEVDERRGVNSQNFRSTKQDNRY